MKTVNVSLVSLSFALVTAAVGCGGAGDASTGDGSGQAVSTSRYTVTSQPTTLAVIAPAQGDGLTYPILTIPELPAAAKAINDANAAQFAKEIKDFTASLEGGGPSDPDWDLESNFESACNLYNTKANIISLECGGAAGGGAHPDDFVEAFNWTIDASGAKPIALKDVFSSTDALKNALRTELTAVLNADNDEGDTIDYVGESDLSVFFFDISKEGHAQITVDVGDALPQALIGDGPLAIDLSKVKSSLVANGPGAALLAAAP